jgi:hypothetical protein
MARPRRSRKVSLEEHWFARRTGDEHEVVDDLQSTVKITCSSQVGDTILVHDLVASARDIT